MTAPTADKKKSWPLSLNQTEISYIENRMTKRKQVDRTAFVQSLVMQDNGLQEEPITTLAELFAPPAEDRLRLALKEYSAAHAGFDQGQLLAYLLDAVLKALRDNRDLMHPFEIMSSAEKAEYQKKFQDLARQFHRNLEVLAKRIGDPSLLLGVNEDAAAKSPALAVDAPGRGEGGRGPDLSVDDQIEGEGKRRERKPQGGGAAPKADARTGTGKK